MELLIHISRFNWRAGNTQDYNSSIPFFPFYRSIPQLDSRQPLKVGGESENQTL